MSIADAGLLLSNSVIRKIMSSLDWCVKNAFYDSDDDNVGQCVLHATGISCQESVQVCVCQFHNFLLQMTALLFYICNLQSIPNGFLTINVWLQGYTLSSYTLHRSLNMEDIEQLTKDPNLDHALTVYPVQEPHILFQLHAYFCMVSNLNNAVMDKNVV